MRVDPHKAGNSPGQGAAYVQLEDLVRLRYEASGFSFLPRQPVHSVLSGRHSSKLRGRGLNFEELRNYLPGDDTRNIDWRVTARTRKPHVRIYTEEKDRQVWLLIDQRINMFFGSRGRMKSVTAAQIAAISAWRVLSVGDRVGAIVFNDSDSFVIPPHRSEERVMQVLNQVVRLNHALNASTSSAPGPGMLNTVLKKASTLARHDCLVCLVTDADGIDEETRKYVTRLSEHNDVLAAFIYDPLEREIPAAGRLRFTDGQRHLEADTSGRRIRHNFKQAFEQKQERLQTASRRLALPVLAIDTTRPVADQLREAFGHHLDTASTRMGR